ncbi:hypothetical protein [Priestia megaterium]
MRPSVNLAEPEEVAPLPTQVVMSIVDSAWAIHDFWTTVYQATGD